MNNKIIDMIKRYGEENDFYGKISEDDIKLVEKSLGIIFPESYKWFILNYGSGGICGVEILGIENKEDSSVIHVTERYRKLGLENVCIVIEDLGEFIMKKIIEVVKSKKAIIGTGLVILGGAVAGILLSANGTVEDFTDNVMDQVDNYDDEQEVIEV